MKYFQVASATPHTVQQGVQNRIVHADGLTAAFWNMGKGAPLSPHCHEQEQILYVISGALEIEASGKKVVVRAGEMLVFPSNEQHGGVALEDTFVMDVFTPCRDDFKSKFPALAETVL